MSDSQDRSQNGLNKLFNDSVHGHIELPPLCVTIIDTPIFQRLRQVKQLGFTYYVYPGAAHNRFEHSLGVCYLAGEIVDVLNRNRDDNDPDTKITKEEKLCLQIAGLCHDLGHGPFSHTWEKFMTRATETKWKHESISVKLFGEILKIPDVAEAFQTKLTENDKNIIENMILGKKPAGEKRAFLYEIISNEDTGIDVDKWDYLLRDSKHLNINITFDPHRLMKCQRIMRAKDHVYHICYRNKAQLEIYQMYMMRAELHRRAYQHQVVVMIEEMWIDALEQLNKDGYTFYGKRLHKVPEDLKLYVRLTDELFDTLYYEKQGTSVEHLLYKINRRQLFINQKQEILETRGEYEDIEMNVNNKREIENIDLYVTKIELEMKSLDELSKAIILYKKDGNFDKCDWKSVPTFMSSQNGSFTRTEVIFYSKICKSAKRAAIEIWENHNRKKRRVNNETH